MYERGALHEAFLVLWEHEPEVALVHKERIPLVSRFVGEAVRVQRRFLGRVDSRARSGVGVVDLLGTKLR